MTLTPDLKFKAVNWSPNEMVGERKMDIMNENTEWLYRNTPRATYTLPGGIRKTEGVKIASGRAIISQKNKTSAAAEVRFGNFFSTRCEPNITTGVVSAAQPRIFCVVRGIGTVIPDHRGFRAVLSVAQEDKKKTTISRTMYVGWQAMGY